MHSFSASYRPVQDSRVTSTSRRSSATGYLARPCVDSRLDAQLPPFEIRAHRIVQLGDEAWELWSPNSQQNPFLPGLIEDTLRVEVAGSRSERRSDGHLGRFDPCVSPQYSSGHPAWAPLVRRVPYSSLECPEFADILNITDGSPRSRCFVRARYVDELLQRNAFLDARITELMVVSRNNPSVALEDVWRLHRPTINADDINDLRSLRSFDRALDDVTQMQRNFKMKAAWIDWVEHLQSTPSWSRASSRPFDLADDSYMGIWINSMEQEDIDWFLAHRIPCFVAHKLIGNELESLFDAGYGRRDATFVHGTPVDSLSGPANRLEAFLRRQGVTIIHSDIDESVRREEPSSPPFALAASFSLSHLDWARGVGTPIAYTPLPSIAQTAPPATIHNIDFSNWDAEPLDFVEVDPRRVAWIRPPPVACAPPGRKWEKWAEENVNGQLLVNKVGRTYSNIDGASYFDRSFNREIILLEEAPMLPGVVSQPEVFGLPCPRHLHFVITPQNKNPRPAKASSWLYLTKDPAHHDVGLRATYPHPEALPLKDEFRVGGGGSDQPPSPPPSPGHPAPPPSLPFVPYESPVLRGVPDSERPASPADSLLLSPRAVNWDLELGDSMGPQIPNAPIEDVEMSTVDLGDESPELPVQSLPLNRSTRPSSPQPRQAPSPQPLSPQNASQQPLSSPTPSRNLHRSPPSRGNRKHARQRSRTPSPPRRRGDSYRPSNFINRREEERRPYNPPRDWPPPPVPNPWAPSNSYQTGTAPVPWGQSPGFMPWGFNPPTQTPWAVHYPGYYPSEGPFLPGWPPLGYPPMPSHSCPSCHNCASCGRPPAPANVEPGARSPPDTSTPSLLGRMRSPPTLPTRTSAPLAQRLRDPTQLLERMAPPSSLAQRMQPPPDFVQGSSSRPLAGASRSLAQRLGAEPEEGELSDWDEDDSTSRARRSRRGGRKERERDRCQAERGAPPAPGKGKRRDRTDRDDEFLA